MDVPGSRATAELSGETLMKQQVLGEFSRILRLLTLLCSESVKVLSRFGSNKTDTHVYGPAVGGVNNDGHLPQMSRSSHAAVQVDLLQQDSGHHVSGEAQVSRADGWEGQGRHMQLLSLIQTVSNDGHQLLMHRSHTIIVGN